MGTADFTPYEAINPNGVSAADILDTYNACMLQPVPTFGAEGNYFSCQKAKRGLRRDQHPAGRDGQSGAVPRLVRAVGKDQVPVRHPVCRQVLLKILTDLLIEDGLLLCKSLP